MTPRSSSLLPLLLAGLLLGALASTASAQVRPRDFRGTNYLPGTTRARDNVLAFLPQDHSGGLAGDFSSSQIADELDLLASLGLNNIRVFPGFWGYLIDKAAYMDSLRELARLAAARGIRITYVVWNVITITQPSQPGGSLEPWEVLCGCDPARPTQPQLYQDILQRDLAVNRVMAPAIPPGETHFYAIHPEPGLDIFLTHGGDPALWPCRMKERIDLYLDAIARFFSTDPVGRAAFASYDLFNEPNALGPAAEPAYLRFIQYTYQRLRASHPAAAVTVGWAASDDLVDLMDQVLSSRWGVQQSYLSGHAYARPDLFDELAAERAAYAGSRGKDFVMSELHRVDISAGVLGSLLSSTVRHGIGGQVWGAIQSNAWLYLPNGIFPIDGVFEGIDPGTASAPIRFRCLNSRDAEDLGDWGTGTLVPRPFTRIELTDGQGRAAGDLQSGEVYQLDVRSVMAGEPVLLLIGLEASPPPDCELVADPQCFPLFGLGSLYLTPATFIAVAGAITGGGGLASPLTFLVPPLPPTWLSVAALVGGYPIHDPVANTAELSRTRSFAIR